MNFSISAKLTERGYNVDALAASAIGSFNTAVAGLAKQAQNEWIRIAQSRLNSSRETYIQGLRQAESFVSRFTPGSQTHEITLVGRMPNNYEFGMPPYDMKTVRPGWLGGRASKRSKKTGKRYVVIPFRHSEGGAFPYTGKAALPGVNMKARLRDAVKEYGLSRMVRIGAGVVEGPVSRVPRSAPVHPYLKGLTRVQKGLSTTTPRGKQRGSSQLMTWRVMSENSPAGSWQHPGLTAVNLLPEVERYVDSNLGNIITTIMGE